MSAQVLRVEEQAAPYLVAPQLTDQRDTFASAPEGFKRLRELVLNLAVRGRLVPQDPSDESGEGLLRRIASDKAQLIGLGEIRRGIPSSAIAQSDEPFRLPRGWKWARLAELTLTVKSGGTPSKNNPSYWDGPIRWASVKDLGFGEPIVDTQDSITDAGLGNGSVLIQPGAIIVCTRMGLGKIGETKIPLAINQDLKALQLGDGVNKAYFISFFKTLSLRGTGMTVSGIKQDELLGLPVPLPPLAEQSRIVAKVEELMALIDRLEEKVSRGDTARGKLLDTLLAALAESPDAAATAEAWAQLAPHFDLLLQTPADVDRLQQTLLTLAVKGRLVPQDPKGEPAAELPKRIRAETEIKRGKLLATLADDDQPFTMPNGWQSVRVADICSLVTDGEHATPIRTEDCKAVPLVTAKNVRDGQMDYTVTDFVPADVAQKCWQRCKPQTGDILMVSVGATLGRLTVLRHAKDMVLVRSVTVLRPIQRVVSPDYMALHLKSPNSQKEIWSVVRQSAQPCLYLAKSAALNIALPPLPEQSRIVAAVASLAALCDRLRECLAARRDLSAQLAAALSESVLA